MQVAPVSLTDCCIQYCNVKVGVKIYDDKGKEAITEMKTHS